MAARRYRRARKGDDFCMLNRRRRRRKWASCDTASGAFPINVCEGHLRVRVYARAVPSAMSWVSLLIDCSPWKLAGAACVASVDRRVAG